MKAVCPLCKQPFKRIIYNVRSFDDFDQYEIPVAAPPPDHLWENPGGLRFRYRTTLTNDRRLDLPRRRHPAGSLTSRSLQAPATRVTTRAEWRRRRQETTAAFRRRIYDNDMWVTPVSPTRYVSTLSTDCKGIY